MGSMLSIGQMADATGASPRMLRHWEEWGLLRPAQVDPHTGYRRYAAAQVGRVRAITALRSAGFPLERINELLDAGLPQERLVDLLQERAATLVAQIDEAQAQLHTVHTRIENLSQGQAHIADAMTLESLPALCLRGFQAPVHDETEIPVVVSELFARLRQEFDGNDQEIVLLYDGSHAEVITVSVATLAGASHSQGQEIALPAAAHGVSITFSEHPGDISDAWILIDAQLQRQGMQTTNVYRQLLHASGQVRLQAPVRRVVDTP